MGYELYNSSTVAVLASAVDVVFVFFGASCASWFQDEQTFAVRGWVESAKGGAMNKHIQHLHTYMKVGDI